MFLLDAKMTADAEGIETSILTYLMHRSTRAGGSSTCLPLEEVVSKTLTICNKNEHSSKHIVTTKQILSAVHELKRRNLIVSTTSGACVLLASPDVLNAERLVAHALVHPTSVTLLSQHPFQPFIYDSTAFFDIIQKAWASLNLSTVSPPTHFVHALFSVFFDTISTAITIPQMEMWDALMLCIFNVLSCLLKDNASIQMFNLAILTTTEYFEKLENMCIQSFSKSSPYNYTSVYLTEEDGKVLVKKHHQGDGLSNQATSTILIVLGAHLITALEVSQVLVHLHSNTKLVMVGKDDCVNNHPASIITDVLMSRSPAVKWLHLPGLAWPDSHSWDQVYNCVQQFDSSDDNEIQKRFSCLQRILSSYACF